MLSARDSHVRFADTALVHLNGGSLDLQIVISVDASHHTVRCELLRTTPPTGTRVEHYATKSRDIRDMLNIIQDT